jgi:hypothetical protein
LNTSLAFVANQSTNLKISQYSWHRISELISQAEVSSLSDAERAAARMATAQYMVMPTLLMSIWPLQSQQFSCAGTISATLSAYVKGSAPRMADDVRDVRCPICKSPAQELGRIGDATGFICPIHKNFKVADTVSQWPKDYCTRGEWPRESGGKIG